MRTLVFFLAGVCLLATIVWAQDDYTLKVDVDLVLFNVSVTDKSEQSVSGLAATNFQIYEDGRPQPVDFFLAEDNPATIGLVIDNSGSMGRKREKAVTAALAFAGAANPMDELFIVNFNENVSMGLPPSRSFTSDLSELRTALLHTGANGRTALYDAISTSLRHLNLGHHQRKALVVLSDGADNASATTLDSTLSQVERSTASVYTVGIYEPEDPDKNPGVLKKLAHVGGGEAYFPSNINQLPAIWERIAGGIRSEYTLGFISRKGSIRPGEFRRVNILAKNAEGKTLRVRTREGYAAESKPGMVR